MRLRKLPARLAARLAHPQTTVRWRLTLLYGGLFLASGAALLAITYTLVANATFLPPKPAFIKSGVCKATERSDTRVTGAAAQLPDVVCRDAQVAAPAGQARAPTAQTTQPNVKTKVPPAEVQRLLGTPAGGAVVRFAANGQRGVDLHRLEIESGIALAIMTIVAAALGWVVAGRVLRPLRTITASTQEISEASLHHRLAMPGPRDELRMLAATIDGLLERLEGAFDAQRRFVANASHELRTPLTATRALLEMALSDPRATVETFRDTCRQALDEGEQQERLIDALLALAQGQRGIDQREVIDLSAVTRDVLEAHEAGAAAAGVGLAVSLKPTFVCGDRRLIERLASNLVENAIRHNSPSGLLQVLVEPAAGRARLRITNTGPAVPPEEIERLLQPFQRLLPDRVGHSEGAGLGLSIVAAIATAHQAALDIRPGMAGGLEVEVRFPLEDGDPHAEAMSDGSIRRARRSPIPA